jgi:hypothetical protein
MNVEVASELVWFKSSYSTGQGGECLEVATCLTTIHVRDSKHLPEHGGAALALAPASWDAFLGFAARG